jgi:hypothetical protein
MDLCNFGAVGEWLAVAGNAGPVGIDHHGIGEDRSHQLVGLADGDNLPVFISPELGEREPARYLHAVLVLRGYGLAAQDGQPRCNDHHQPGCNFPHVTSPLQFLIEKIRLVGASAVRATYSSEIGRT